MKFLLFNVAVATALMFLFTADRGEVQKIAGQVHDAAGDMKAYANKALDAGQTILRRDAAAPAQTTSGTSAVVPPKPATPPATALPIVRPVAQPVQPPAAVTPKQGPSSAPRQLARKIAPVPEAAVRTSALPTIKRAAPAGLDPAVAKRRNELLDGLDTTADTVARAPALKEGSRLMTPSERRKELLSLAEEMELLYARSISQ